MGSSREPGASLVHGGVMAHCLLWMPGQARQFDNSVQCLFTFFLIFMKDFYTNTYDLDDTLLLYPPFITICLVFVPGRVIVDKDGHAYRWTMYNSLFFLS
jgi:hypothetical protein